MKRGPVTWPVRVAPVGSCSVGSALWRVDDGQPNVTVIVKATFSFGDGAAMVISKAQSVRIRDTHVDNDPMCSLTGADETAPQKPIAGVHVTGHAYSPGGSTRGIARLVVRRGTQSLIDKSVLVVGPRRADGSLAAFHRLPMGYEYALGGVGFAANPIGTGAGASQDHKPQLLHPTRPKTDVACFAPVPAIFPQRRKLRGDFKPKRAFKGISNYPSSFSWAYFCASPEDQRVGGLRGDEIVELYGMHPTCQQIVAQLPSATAGCRIYGASTVGVPNTVPLIADTLHIEPDTQTCSLVWRGSFPIASELAAASLLIAGAVSLPGMPVQWPPDARSLIAYASPASNPGMLSGAREDDMQHTAQRLADADTGPSLDLESTRFETGPAREPVDFSATVMGVGPAQLPPPEPAAEEDFTATVMVARVPAPVSTTHDWGQHQASANVGVNLEAPPAPAVPQAVAAPPVVEDFTATTFRHDVRDMAPHVAEEPIDLTDDLIELDDTADEERMGTTAPEPEIQGTMPPGPPSDAGAPFHIPPPRDKGG